MGKKAKYFYRYTDLAAAVHLLRSRRITLLDPMRWDDKNDVFFMEEYKRRAGAKAVLALCFVEGAEKYHHWKIFSYGPHGVSIHFRKDKLLSKFEECGGVRHDYVKYLSTKEMKRLFRETSSDFSKLPFRKRLLYRQEREYRVIYEDAEKEVESKDFEIHLSWIKRIRLSPWMPKPLVKSMKETLRAIHGCSDLKIIQSTAIDSPSWKETVEENI